MAEVPPALSLHRPPRRSQPRRPLAEEPRQAPARKPRRSGRGAGPQGGAQAAAGLTPGLLLQAPQPKGGKGLSRDTQGVHVAHPGAARGPQGCPPSPRGPSVLV